MTFTDLIGIFALGAILWMALHDNRVDQPPEEVRDEVEDEPTDWWRHLL